VGNEQTLALCRDNLKALFRRNYTSIAIATAYASHLEEIFKNRSRP
jgi:hypothetical protein